MKVEMTSAVPRGNKTLTLECVAHLHSLEHVPEHGALLPLVRLGSVLVAVRGQRVQLVAQLVPVLELEILQGIDATNLFFFFQNRKTNPSMLMQTSEELTQSRSLASSNRRAMVSPAAILMLTSSLCSNLGSLGKCLRDKHFSFFSIFFPHRTPTRAASLLAQDVLELAGSADGEQQSPGQQRVGVELDGLGVERGARAVRLGVRPGEQTFKAIHGGLDVLKVKD